MGNKVKRKRTTLYNIWFPIWILLFYPKFWIGVLPINFIIDFVVVYLTLKYLKIERANEKTTSVIFKTWIAGFASDFIGASVLFTSYLIHGDWWYNNILEPVVTNPFESIYAILLVIISIAISGIAIYIFNLKWCLKELEIDIRKKKRLALSIAVFTAPYVFLIPSKWFY